MIYCMPEFYYSGNRHCKSDVDFIKKCLMRMTEKEQRKACAQYRELYLKNYPNGRKQANEFLFNYANENGVHMDEVKKLKATGNSKEWITKRIAELRVAAKSGKPRIID